MVFLYFYIFVTKPKCIAICLSLKAEKQCFSYMYKLYTQEMCKQQAVSLFSLSSLSVSWEKLDDVLGVAPKR